VDSKHGTTFYEYNNKSNYLIGLFPDAYWKAVRMSDYRIIKRTSSNNSSVSTYEYGYNSDGFPIEIITKNDGINGEVLKLTYN